MPCLMSIRTGMAENMAVQSTMMHCFMVGIKIDDTYPAVNDWETATTFAMQLILRKHGDCDIEFLFCKDYISEEYKKYGYIHETPIRLQ